MHTLDEVIAESPLFEGLDPAWLEFIAGCARNVVFRQGDVVFREGDPADTFYLVRRGRIALSSHVPARGDFAIDTVEPGEVVGWSWLFEPYRWHFDAIAAEDVGAVAFDGACLRGKCQQDHELGHALMLRFAQVLIDRLQHTRMRLLDVYGHFPRN